MYKIKNLSKEILERELLEKFLNFVNEQLKINKSYSVYFIEDEHNAENPLGKTAMYNPASYSIYVYTTNRHPKDILRSIAHELVHHKQHCNGDLENMSLEKAEVQANAGGYLLRQFEDSRKETPDSSMNEIDASRFKAGGGVEKEPSSQDVKKMLKTARSKVLWNNLYKKWKKGEMPFLEDEKSFNKWAKETGLPSIEAQMRAREMTRASHAMAFAQFLDVVGVIPVAGEFADVASAAIKYNYAQMVERDEGFDKAMIYYIDAAISLAAATVAGEVLKVMAKSLSFLGRKGIQGGLWALSKARGVPPELIIQDLKDGLKTIGQKVGARFSKSRLASSRLAKQLDVAAVRLRQVRIARNALAKLSAKDIEKMSAKEFLEFIATNPMTRDRFKQAVRVSLTASPELAEVLFKRRLKYFYDMPNTKNNLMSSEFAEEVLDNLNIPLGEITKLLSKVTEKQADNIYAFLEFLLMANKKGVVGVSGLVSEFGSRAIIDAKSGSEIADIALNMYSREFSKVFEDLVSVPGKAQDVFNRMLIGGGFKDAFEEALKKALKEADELLLKIENGSLKLSDEAFTKQMQRLSPEYIIAQLFRPKSKLTQGMQETASEYILDLTTKKKGLVMLDNLMFSMFPKIKAFVTKTAPVLGAFISKNFLGRRYLTDGLPVNYGGKVIGGTAAKFLEVVSYLPLAGWLFTPFKFRSARQTIEAAVAATIASAITYNRFFKVIYPEIPGGGGTEGVGDKAPISAGQQAAADEARKGVEKSNDVIERNGKKYKTMPANPASFQPSNVKKEVEEVKKNVEKSDLPPEVKEKVNKTLEKIKKSPEKLPEITRKQQAKARENIKNVERKIPKAAAPKGMPDAKGKGLKNVKTTANKGKGVPGVGAGSGGGRGEGTGAGEGTGRTKGVISKNSFLNFIDEVSPSNLDIEPDDEEYIVPKEATDTEFYKKVGKGAFPTKLVNSSLSLLKTYRDKVNPGGTSSEIFNSNIIKSKINDPDVKEQIEDFPKLKSGESFISSDKILNWVRNTEKVLNKLETLNENVFQRKIKNYRKELLNSKFDKLTKGLTK